MHFIVGHPRSGTHLLADLLNAAGPKVAMHEAFVELSPEESFIALATDYYEGRAGAEVVKEAIRSYPLPAAIRVDANWKNTWVLPVLLEMYPEARVLHLTRDPRRNVVACQNMGYYSEIGFNPAFPIYSKWLRAMPVVARADWQWLSIFERNCAFWVESHRLALEARTSLGARYARIKMEELRDPETIARLFAFFRMAVPPAEAIERVLAKAANPQARIKAYVESEFADMQLPAFEDCPLPLQEGLARICAPMALELDYRLP